MPDCVTSDVRCQKFNTKGVLLCPGDSLCWTKGALTFAMKSSLVIQTRHQQRSTEQLKLTYTLRRSLGKNQEAP